MVVTNLFSRYFLTPCPLSFLLLVSRSGMTIDGKGLLKGTPHDEMVEEFGLTWGLAGASLGHIVGAGAILGCQAGGFL